MVANIETMIGGDRADALGPGRAAEEDPPHEDDDEPASAPDDARSLRRPGTKSGTTNLSSTISTAATTPGQSRSGFRARWFHDHRLTLFRSERLQDVDSRRSCRRHQRREDGGAGEDRGSAETGKRAGQAACSRNNSPPRRANA